ncbi:hypothetical protein Tco_1260088 [Tanacetum coccineum]
MTKVNEGEFEKLETLKINDVSLTCDTSLEIFHDEFNRLSNMDDDLFTYEVEIAGIANVPCDLNKDDDSEQQMSQESDDDMEYDPSDGEEKITTWEELVEKFFCKFYPKSYDREEEMLDEGNNWGIDPLEFISRVNSSFKNYIRVDGRTKKDLTEKKSIMLVKYLQSRNLEVLES